MWYSFFKYCLSRFILFICIINIFLLVYVLLLTLLYITLVLVLLLTFKWVSLNVKFFSNYKNCFLKNIYNNKSPFLKVQNLLTLFTRRNFEDKEDSKITNFFNWPQEYILKNQIIINHGIGGKEKSKYPNTILLKSNFNVHSPENECKLKSFHSMRLYEKKELVNLEIIPGPSTSGGSAKCFSQLPVPNLHFINTSGNPLSSVCFVPIWWLLIFIYSYYYYFFLT